MGYKHYTDHNPNIKAAGKASSGRRNKFNLIYATFPAKDEALKAARECVKDKLIACANVFDNLSSIYEWEGKVCEEAECIAIMKTNVAKTQHAINKIKSLHSYECPCIVVIPICGGSSAFLGWIEKVCSKHFKEPGRKPSGEVEGVYTAVHD